jgi:hypothetical protein
MDDIDIIQYYSYYSYNIAHSYAHSYANIKPMRVNSWSIGSRPFHPYNPGNCTYRLTKEHRYTHARPL